MSAVAIDRVTVVFGPRPEAALRRLDAGQDRAEVQRETGQTVGVHDCSLEVAAGEIVVLMGLSGSGKSTLLRAINGLAPVARGEVRIDSGDGPESVTHARPRDLRRLRQTRVAMVFQAFGLLPWRRVRENVGLGLELAGMPRAERRAAVDRQLALVGLSDWADRRVAELSGGMQQRVGLARAFATEAPILLMDEPFGALDPLIRAHLQDELLALQARLGRTIVFVTHDLDEAFRLGGRIAIMEAGRIVQTGTPAEIVSRPASAHVAAFVARMNPLDVLTAADAMGPGGGEGPPVAAAMPVRALIALCAVREAPIPVERDGRIVGAVDRGTLLARLARSGDPDGGPIGAPPPS